jgi:hypothetical protein
MKEVTVCDNKKIHIFDNLFSLSERIFFHEFATFSRYQMTVMDNNYNAMSSFYDDRDISRLGLNNTQGYKIVDEMFNLSERKMLQIRVNCTNISTKNKPHTDTSIFTFLYHVNLEWKIYWGGHICFTNENLDDFEYICAFKPGRLVVFDSTIPHFILNPTREAEDNRLTLIIQYG